MLRRVLFLILIIIPVFEVYAQKNNQDEVVAIVEHDFYSSSIYKTSFIETGIAECEKFEKYNPIDEYEIFSSHGERVIRSFWDESEKEYKILPLAIDSGNKLSPIEIINRFYEVFDCLTKVSKKFNLAGVNFSSGAQDFLLKDLTEEERKVLLAIENKFTTKIKLFLDNNKNTIMTMAMGNSPSRLEDSISLPLSASCNENINNVNLLCITSFYLNHAYEFGASQEDPREFRIGDYIYSYVSSPDGTTENPLPITGRYTTSSRLVAVGSYKAATSFWSPLFLAKALNHGPKIKDGYGVTYSSDSMLLETYPIRYTDE